MGSKMEFGAAMDVNIDKDILAVSSTGINTTLDTTFDGDTTIFDSGITQITGTEAGSGVVYVYHKKQSRFVYTQELIDNYVIANPGNNFGSSVIVDDNTVVVGMPSVDNTALLGGFVVFDKIDITTNSLKVISRQDTFVDPSTVQRIAVIDTDKSEVVEYLDLFDPLKGRIPGLAEQELSYKLINDPAVYSIGVLGVNIDTTKNWLDDHVGELWWDLSTAKYQWYEQSDLEFRKNNWGKLFPGATIDVYEWVSSTLLPSEWAIQADTATGLANGVSGQPKFVDNSVISVKQVYDAITNSFTNVYYYWVKNKTIAPNRKNRRLSSYDIATIIADPKAYGLKYAAIIDANAIMLGNCGGLPIGNRISINIAQDLGSEFIPSPRHTQWFLLEEGSDVKMPPRYLEDKMLDSLLGYDKIGNIVPDPDLSFRTKYGIGIRPRQTMFNDKRTALRNIIEFANDVLLSVPTNGYYSFKNLNSQEEIPDQYGNTYDYLVEDNITLESVDTTGWRQAILNCSVDSNGHVDGVIVADSGYGYGNLNPVYSSTGTVVGYEGPTFTVDNTVYGTTFDDATTTFDDERTRFIARDLTNIYADGLLISTIVDDTGSIIQATIVNSGKRFGSHFRLVSRPHAAIVQSDDTYNGKWTKFEWDYVLQEWVRAHTQSFNTPLYWDYVDYASADFNKFQIYSSVIGSPFELNGLTLVEGQYVKINNGGDGNFIILKKNADGVYGTYGNGFDLVFKQNGTIQFKNDLWQVRDNNLNWDYQNTYDQTLWDQTPNKELEYIFAALKNDLFIYELKANWNLLFFKAVKYALTEQKFLDWAFKTSFITLTHNVGELTQPPVYKMQDSTYYEDYVKEVKPYHSQIRQFVTKYTITEIENTSTPQLLTLANTQLEERSTTTSIVLKFDRTSFDNTVGDFEVLDTFLATGIDKSFDLSWVPAYDKIGTVVKINGIIALGSEWTIDYTESVYNGFHKKFAKLYTLAEEPLDAGTTITVGYKKNANILNETERVLAYYTSTYGIVGLDLGSLVDGISYPGLEVGGRYEGPGFSNPYGGVTPDSLINGGTWADKQRVSALGVNPEDITLTGEVGFINTFSGHAPAEMLPGFVVDSLGVNVYTVGQSAGSVITKGSIDFEISTSTQYFSLPMLPVSVDSISVILNNSILDYTTHALNPYNFSIDWINSLLLIPPQATTGTLYYSLIGIGGGTSPFGLVDYNTAIIQNNTSGTISSNYFANAITDVSITVNGNYIIPTTYSLDLTAGNTGSAVVSLVGLDPTGANVVQAWFLSESHENYSQIVGQESSTSTFMLTSTGTHVVELIQNNQVKQLTTSQYTIVGSTLTLAGGVMTLGDTVKVITYVDPTGQLEIRTEEFVGSSGREFVMSSSVPNDNYVWVSIIRSDGTTYKLIPGVDFIILGDNVTIVVDDSWDIDSTDTIEMICFNGQSNSASALGFRIFKDMLGGTTFTRLSAGNTTYLTSALKPTDSEIHVNDASVLTGPNINDSIPGVILINSERIEFFQIDGNSLKQITRATMGTGINGELPMGTKVVDQGTGQEFLTSEGIDIQYHYTTGTTSSYVIGIVDTEVAVPNTTATVSSKGITLNTDLSLIDQVDVYLGGRQLRKTAQYYHDTTVVLDNVPMENIKDSVSSATDLLSIYADVGDSYIENSTGKIFTYTRTRKDDNDVPGWVYSGMTYLEPEYSVVVTATTQIIHLNNSVESNLELAIVYKTAEYNDFNDVVTTGTTLSLWDSTSTVALFLKAEPTELPPAPLDSLLKNDQGQPLTDENGEFLRGNT